MPLLRHIMFAFAGFIYIGYLLASMLLWIQIYGETGIAFALAFVVSWMVLAYGSGKK